MSNYILKLKALLHDPVHKIWCFQNVKSEDISHKEVLDKNKRWHEKVALDLFKFILDEDLDDEKIKTADQIASALSRIIVAPKIENVQDRNQFDEETSVSFNDAIYIDTFKQEEFKPICAPKNYQEVESVFEKIGNLNFKTQEERSKFAFLFLWRFLPDVFHWIEKHPADSRAPNHSIYDHLVQSSAIATCLDNNDKPSFLLFTITPVQSFIATARKTQDLWAGSYLLSYLIYKTIEVIIEEIGPDQIIFPNLRCQPLVDHWLYERHFKEVTMDIEVFKKWKEEEDWNKFSTDGNEAIAQKISIANFPNRFLAIVPNSKAKEIAQKCKDKIKEIILDLLKNSNHIEKKVKPDIVCHIISYLKPYYVILSFDKNGITDVDTVLEEYKNLAGENELLKVIEIIKTHPYYKNTNIGSCYSLLVELTERFLASRKMLKDFTVIPKQTGEKCHLCGEYDILNLDWSKLVPHYVNKAERLCGVCLFKRLLPDIMKKKYRIEVKYPSTSEMATVIYKRCLDEKKTQDFLSKLNEVFNNTFPQTISVPALKDNCLYNIDGQWLMESSYRKNYIEKEFGISVDENKLEEMKKFLQDNKIDPPVYYSILAMDGDNIGKWLNGSFMPKVKELIHPKVANILECYAEKDKELYTLLNSNHPMSPSFHNQFSRRLLEFALNDVRTIVEDEYYGKLIYAGGDDVLVFLPVEKAVDCGYKINKRFREILGEKASMSAGIVFVHHKYPLSLALEEVRNAEKSAKVKYGRSSFCIKYISGSGQSRITGMKWKEKEFFDEVIKKYCNGELSSKFAYDFMEVVKEICTTNKTIDENIHYILTNELKRLYRHKLKKEKCDKGFEKKLIEQLNKFKDNYEAFGDMLIITRFIASIL